jgi:hypothetical protein
MLDGNTASGGWLDFFNKSATNTLRRSAWRMRANGARSAGQADSASARWVPYFIISANPVLPNAVQVSYWNGADWVPVSNQHVD